MTVRSGQEGVRLAPGLSAIMNERRRLIGVAYRLLCPLAENAVQETAVASRVCLNMLGSARTRREHFGGEWAPEPEPAAWNGGRSGAASAERVAFVSQDVFRSPFAEAAQTVGRTPTACRRPASWTREGAA
ncbi:hypothetical protein ACFVH6_08235 [Spirillospora sp. NPDC127200]